MRSNTDTLLVAVVAATAFGILGIAYVAWGGRQAAAGHSAQHAENMQVKRGAQRSGKLVPSPPIVPAVNARTAEAETPSPSSVKAEPGAGVAAPPAAKPAAELTRPEDKPCREVEWVQYSSPRHVLSTMQLYYGENGRLAATTVSQPNFEAMGCSREQLESGKCHCNVLDAKCELGLHDERLYQTYDYDSNDQLTEIRTPATPSSKFEFSYDELGRVHQISADNGVSENNLTRFVEVSLLKYHGTGRLAAMTSSTLTEDRVDRETSFTFAYPRSSTSAGRFDFLEMGGYFLPFSGWSKIEGVRSLRGHPGQRLSLVAMFDAKGRVKAVVFKIDGNIYRDLEFLYQCPREAAAQTVLKRLAK
jgi:YD repeat-containing protein